MHKGKIKFFNEVSGYGFIEPEKKGNDVFFHFSAMKEGNLIDKTAKGRSVQYETKEGKKGAEGDKIEFVKEISETKGKKK